MVRFDAHCHLFNMWFPIREVVAIAWDMLRGEYPRGTKKRDIDEGYRRVPKLKELLDIVIQVGQIVNVFTGSYLKNYQLLEGKFKHKDIYGKATEVCAIPLMMDIYFTFADEFESTSQENIEPIRGNGREEFDSWFREAENTLLVETGRNIRDTHKLKTNEKKIHEGMRSIYRDIVENYSREQRGVQIIMTPGYKKEIKQCISLQKKKTGQVYPFLAVDPRRKGILALIEDGSSFKINGPLVSKDGPFYGIKLYPRLGYLPKDCKEIITWCSKNGIPITTHTSKGGYPFWKDKYAYNGSIKNWKAVLDDETISNLTVNFAHFGANNLVWRNDIINAIKDETRGNRIFSDISCFTETEDLENAKQAYLANPELKGRLMFGTDYDIMLITGLGYNLKKYLKNFREVFSCKGSKDMEDDLTITAPCSFLGI